MEMLHQIQNHAENACGKHGLADLLAYDIGEEEAVSLIVNGFCKEVMQHLPMEFAIEAAKLINISLEDLNNFKRIIDMMKNNLMDEKETTCNV